MDIFFFECMNFLIEKPKSAEMNAASILQIGVVLVFTVIYLISISLKTFFEHIEIKWSLQV